LQNLRNELGSPEKTATSDLSDQPEATWRAAKTVRIDFYEQDRRLVLIGPYGKSLEPDVALRKEIETY
jgi:hypothetical protein